MGNQDGKDPILDATWEERAYAGNVIERMLALYRLCHGCFVPLEDGDFVHCATCAAPIDGEIWAQKESDDG